ncbi:MAG: ABC transporter permease [Candidatus Paceibacterota bacterium]|jgi:ABC-type polysaccharide/polyol phosphate export permease
MNPLLQEIKSVLGLSLSLAKANFKVRNEGSFLGIFWYLLEPLVFFLILFFISSTLAQDSIEKYPLYLFIGLIMFNFWSAVTGFSTQVISSHSGFIKSLKIKMEPFVLSGVWQFIFSHLFELVALLIFAFFFQVDISWLIFYPIILFFFTLFTAGISLILSVCGVYIGDLRNVWVVFTRLLWFATPIFYSINPSSPLHRLNTWNPLSYFITAARDIVIYQKIPSVETVTIITLGSIAVFLLGLLIFEKFKNRLAEKL